MPLRTQRQHIRRQQENTDDDTPLRSLSTIQPIGQTKGLPPPPQSKEPADRERRLREDAETQEHRRQNEERQFKEERMKQEERWRQEEMRLHEEKK